MSEIVFVLGAGASAHCGTPLMGDFLEVAQDLLRMGEVGEVREDFESVFAAVGNLHAIQSKAQINTYDIEDVYAAFEMGKLLGRLPGIEEADKLEGLTSSIRKVIGYTLEKTTKVPADSRINPFQSYWAFTLILGSLIKVGKSCSVITFNYDLGLDYSLYKNGLLPDYCLGDLVQEGKHVTCLKLHGSLNWGKCRKCGRIIPYRQFGVTEHRVGRDYNIIPAISGVKKLTCGSCGEKVHEDPFIVPPTWNKTAFHEQIDQVWRRAASELKDAENIFVLGYSFRSTDLFFQYLFALGIDMKTILRGFYVYDIDPSVKERFRSLLGSGVRQKFHFYEVPFETAVQNIAISPGKTIPQILNIKIKL